jgi:hypothetical protein
VRQEFCEEKNVSSLQQWQLTNHSIMITGFVSSFLFIYFRHFIWMWTYEVAVVRSVACYQLVYCYSATVDPFKWLQKVCSAQFATSNSECSNVVIEWSLLQLGLMQCYIASSWVAISNWPRKCSDCSPTTNKLKETLTHCALWSSPIICGVHDFKVL